MPNRTLREGLRSSPIINALSDRAARLYAHLLVSADDFGLMEWTPSWVKATAVPLLLWTMEETSAAMLDISEKKAVRLYEANGKPYAAMEKWEQRQNAKFPRFPAPPWGFKAGESHVIGGYVAPRARTGDAAAKPLKAPGRINGSARRGGREWWQSEEGIEAKGKEVGLNARTGESWPEFKGRITEEIEKKRKSA